MSNIASRFDRIDRSFIAFMARYGITLLRRSIGIIFLWFGLLKFFPGLSPAEDLATRTMHVLSFGLAPPRHALNLLAAWECAVGLGLILGVYLRATLLLL